MGTFFKSKDVKVFPSSYRGYEEVNGHSIPLDPEARLNTEYNYVHAGNGNGYNKSYVVDYSNNVLTCVIGGYYFELKLSTSDDGLITLAALNGKYLCIQLKDLNLSADGNWKTKVLKPWSTEENVESDSVDYLLDNSDGDFVGLSLESTAADSDYSLFIKVDTNTDTGVSTINQSCYLPTLQSGSGTKSLVQPETATFTGLDGETYPVDATGKAAIVLNGKSAATGDRAFASGSSTVASGAYSHTEGVNTLASGNHAHAEGNGTTASESAAHAEGSATQATKIAAHAEGFNTRATNNYAHAEGNNTDASGLCSHAQGHSSGAYAENSFAAGESTKAYQKNQTVVGQFNDNTKTAEILFEVGNGTSSSAKSNALEVHKKGSVRIGNTNNTNNEGELACGQYNKSEIGKTYFAVGGGTAAQARNIFEVGLLYEGGRPEAVYISPQNGNTYISGSVARISTNTTHIGGDTVNKIFVDNTNQKIDILSNGAVTISGSGVAASGQTATITGEHSLVLQNQANLNTYIKLYDASNTGKIEAKTSELKLLDTSNNQLATFDSNGIELAAPVVVQAAASGFSLQTTGQIAATSFYATSDKRLKENIVEYKPEKSILDLPVYKFDFINGAKNNIGCLAQDLKEICPEIVSENGDGYLSINESKIVYLLLDEVKKLKKEVEELKK